MVNSTKIAPHKINHQSCIGIIEPKKQMNIKCIARETIVTMAKYQKLILVIPESRQINSSGKIGTMLKYGKKILPFFSNCSLQELISGYLDIHFFIGFLQSVPAKYVSMAPTHSARSVIIKVVKAPNIISAGTIKNIVEIGKNNICNTTKVKYIA